MASAGSTNLIRCEIAGCRIVLGETPLQLTKALTTLENVNRQLERWQDRTGSSGEIKDLHCHVKDKKAGKTHGELGMVGSITIR